MTRDEAIEIARLHAHAEGNLRSSIVRVTPALAAEWMKQNTTNRRLRPAVVDSYARQMAAGQWRMTHQGVAFTADGELVDGQHRLQSVIKSGVSVDMMVTWGVAADAFAYLDGGVPRSMSDRLKMPRNLVEAANFTLLLTGDKRATAEELRRACETLAPTFQRIVVACGAISKIASSVPVRVSAAVLMLEQPLKAESVLTTYRALVLRHYDDMSPAAKAFVRQIDTGRMSSRDRIDLFARGLVAMDPDRSEVTRVQINDQEVARKRAASVLRLPHDRRLPERQRKEAA